MPVSDIRESIERDQVVSTGNLTIIQKRVNLQGGFRHEILACDIFQDAVLSTDSPYGLVEFFVTPYPVIYTNMQPTTLTDNRGPSAASDTVLFKANFKLTGTDNWTDIRTFPSPQIAAGPTFSFYTPAVYFTMFLHGDGGSIWDNIAFSFLLKVKSVKASTTSYGLGMIRERSVAQGMNLMSQGRTIPQADNVGQIFPMWKYGGIRPEYMLKGDGLRNFFLPYSPQDSEAMQTTGNLRTFVSASRSMSSFEDAFGSVDPVKGPVPDWVRFEVGRGIIAGPIRAQQPPRKLFDNGNTMML